EFFQQFDNSRSSALGKSLGSAFRSALSPGRLHIVSFKMFKQHSKIPPLNMIGKVSNFSFRNIQPEKEERNNLANKFQDSLGCVLRKFLKVLSRYLLKSPKISGASQLIDQHDQRQFIALINQLLIGIPGQRNNKVMKTGNELTENIVQINP